MVHAVVCTSPFAAAVGGGMVGSEAVKTLLGRFDTRLDFAAKIEKRNVRT